MTVSEKLLKLIETGELDWDNERHREAYLKAWASRESLPRFTAEKMETDESERRPASHYPEPESATGCRAVARSGSSY
jgi:hypothetical protein